MLDQFVNNPPPQSLSGAGLTAYILFDIFLIIILARVLGNLITKFGQPRVVGEILAGILLGPTLLGANLSQWIAPLAVRPTLSAIATIGLVLFMFLAGVEYDAKQLKGRVHQSALLSILAVGIPALVGFLIAPLLFTPDFAGPNAVELLPLGLFIGAILAVTAFPVMAHILMERGELNTPLGSLAVACAGLISIFMFTYISFASTIASGQPIQSFWVRLGLIVAFSLISVLLIKPLLGYWLTQKTGIDPISPNTIAILFAGLALYALIAHLLGIHALTGGFIWGFLLPDDAKFRQAVAQRIKDVAMVFFLPVFFALAGFSTDLKLIRVETLPILMVFLAAAIFSKFLAAIPTKLFGFSWGETLTMGALFNTRGLLVLVVGLLGLEYKIITPVTFTLTVVTALVTNLITLPILEKAAQRKNAPIYPEPIIVNETN